MLQLGDKGTIQSKKNFSQAQASAALDGDLCPRTVIWPIQTRPEAYLDALTRIDARFLRLEGSNPLASPTLWRHLYG
jgi:hypothetical protein